ncbi:MAG: hypothetical protein NVV59_08465 [Chitinophagaceae bacterium]|nr:hypothetical protein [Chitinophagaceae bacterium]
MKFRLSAWGRSAVAATVLFITLVAFSAYKVEKTAEDFWKALGITQQAGTNNIKASFLNGYLQYYGAKNMKNIAVGDRQAVAKDLLEYTKNYVQGAEFLKYYNEHRQRAMPEAPEKKPLRSLKEIQKEEIEKTEKSIKDLEKSMKELGGDVAKGLQPLLEQLKQTLKDYQNPNHETFKIIASSEKNQQEDDERRYQENIKRWKQDFPENVKLFIADKLNKMLEATNGIDYNAQLVEKYGKKRFVNPTYESKRREWKQGFRAGKEVTEYARTFVKKWVDELK